MDNKDKMLLVFYTNTIPEHFAHLNNYIKREISGLTSDMDDIIFFLLPDTSLKEGTVKLECLNPKLIEPEKSKQLSDIIDEIERNIKTKDINDSK